MQKLSRGIILCMFLFGLASCQSLSFDLLSSSKADNNITTAVYNSLKAIEDFPVETLHIETAQRTVYLSGYVKTIRQSDVAYSIASSVSGVKKVENNIIVKK